MSLWLQNQFCHSKTPHLFLCGLRVIIDLPKERLARIFDLELRRIVISVKFRFDTELAA